MANYTTNDRGERIIAVGAEGSMARVADEYPCLIQSLVTMYKEGMTDYSKTDGYMVTKAGEMIRAAGVTDYMTIRSIQDVVHQEVMRAILARNEERVKIS